MKQIDIKRATYRIVHETPAHITYGVWANGGKCGDLTVRQEEKVAFETLLNQGGFLLMSPFAPLYRR